MWSALASFLAQIATSLGYALVKGVVDGDIAPHAQVVQQTAPDPSVDAEVTHEVQASLAAGVNAVAQ